MCVLLNQKVYTLYTTQHICYIYCRFYMEHYFIHNIVQQNKNIIHPFGSFHREGKNGTAHHKYFCGARTAHHFLVKIVNNANCTIDVQQGSTVVTTKLIHDFRG